jgi:hypothetical protein
LLSIADCFNALDRNIRPRTPSASIKKKLPIDPTLLPNVKLVASVKISKNDLFFDQTMQSKKLKFRCPKYEAAEALKNGAKRNKYGRATSVSIPPASICLHPDFRQRMPPLFCYFRGKSKACIPYPV